MSEDKGIVAVVVWSGLDASAVAIDLALGSFAAFRFCCLVNG